MNYYEAFMSILLNNFNAEGKVVDQDVCVEIAHFINMQPMTVPHYPMWNALWEFISEHGEDEDMSYIGRDEHGEKQYHTFNPETHWHGRIRRALVELEYYKKWQEVAAQQTPCVV